MKIEINTQVVANNGNIYMVVDVVDNYFLIVEDFNNYRDVLTEEEILHIYTN